MNRFEAGQRLAGKVAPGDVDTNLEASSLTVHVLGEQRAGKHLLNPLILAPMSATEGEAGGHSTLFQWREQNYKLRGGETNK